MSTSEAKPRSPLFFLKEMFPIKALTFKKKKKAIPSKENTHVTMARIMYTEQLSLLLQGGRFQRKKVNPTVLGALTILLSLSTSDDVHSYFRQPVFL